ncbi:hypothetical protein P5F62_01875 [Clostridium perfringens]|nr:hypothetical protein [Clostridium perfringens]
MLKKRAIIILLVSILSMGLISCDNSKKQKTIIKKLIPMKKQKRF